MCRSARRLVGFNTLLWFNRAFLCALCSKYLNNRKITHHVISRPGIAADLIFGLPARVCHRHVVSIAQSVGETPFFFSPLIVLYNWFSMLLHSFRNYL